MPRKLVKDRTPAIQTSPDEGKAVAALIDKLQALQKRRKGESDNTVQRMKVADWLKDHKTLIALIDPVADTLSEEVRERYEEIRARAVDVQDCHEFSAGPKNPDNVQWFPVGTMIDELTFLVMIVQGRAEAFLDEDRARERAITEQKTPSQLSRELMAMAG